GKTQVTTNVNGVFNISVPEKSQLRIAMVGYKTVELAATQGMTVSLEADNLNLNEVVVVGYATQKRELVTGSVENLKFTETSTEIPTTMAGNILAGRMAGVTVGTPTGVPGQSAPGITIRTPNSFSNSQGALYVIDGKISGSGDFNNLSPNEIDNVSVLKDGAAAAVYGSRAAGGVIVVTTKRGEAGKTSIQYSFNTGIDKRTKNESLTSGVQMYNLYNQINSGAIGTVSPADIAWMQNIGGGWGYDQLGAIWRTPVTTTHNLSVSGGTEKLKYFVGGSYVNELGFLRDLSFDKYNFRANVSGEISKNLNFFAGVSLNNNLTGSVPNTPVGDAYGLYTKELVWQPYQPVFTSGGLPIDYGWIANTGAETNGQGGYINSNYLKPVVNMSLTYKVPFIPGLSATASFIKSYADNRTKTFEKQYLMYLTKEADPFMISTNDADIISSRLSSQVNPSLIAESATWGEDAQTNFQLNYERSFNKHHIKALMAYEGFKAETSGMGAQINGFPVYITDQWWAANTQAINSTVSTSTSYSDQITGRKSWVGQAFYDYDEKYIASAAYRYDGSMNFAPNLRWGFFPSGSVGWIASKEKFLKDVKAINFLKVSVSAGLIGNDAVGGWQWQQSYKNGNNAFLGASPSTNAGVTYGAVPNPNLTWEKTFNRNFAVDVDFLDHFSSRVEYWMSNTYDILGSRIQVTPPTFSLALPAVNYGKENAHGIDISINYRTKIGQVNFNTGIVASYGNAWIVTKDETPTYDWQRAVGRSTSYIATYQVVGMIRTQSDLTNLLAQDPGYNFNGIKPALGQFIYADLNGPAGTKDGIITPYDETIIRKSNNPIVVGWNFGASWKGFRIDGTFNGMFHYLKSINDLTGGVEWNRLWSQWATNSWSPSTPNATLPYRYSANDGTRSVFQSGSDFWYKDASFLRLKNLALSYNIPQQYCTKLGIKGLRLYGSGSNLFIISGFNSKYYDPESSNGTYFPILRTFNFGATLSL
ncbi:MAG: SusC/RagA family TonB-linked outer membrane protein, partial [Mucilaginibacter sp.]